MNFYILSIKHTYPGQEYYHYCYATYSRNYRTFDSKSLEIYLAKQICSFLKIFESTYLLVSAKEISKNEIFNILTPYTHLFMKINPKNYYGLLDTGHWDWIKENIVNKEENKNG